ncbi:uncharacterized protein LOC143460124 [Clavelina lepadiformis]|uniref:Vitellogenin n=1 Tax=Clavelina lepadiformis TaxID=159417 RepID=A0ABP0F7L5_CLALP
MGARYFEIKPGYGYCVNINDAHDTVKVYQEISAVHFGVVKSDKNFGNIDVTAKQRKIFWEDIPNPKYLEECLAFDRVPFIVLGRKLLGCKQGVGKLSGKKRKADDNSTTTTPSKWKCPAHISMIEVFKFPDYEIADNSPELRIETAQRLCYDLNNGRAVGERRFYIFFSPPSDHKDHAVLIDGQWVEPEQAVGQQIKFHVGPTIPDVQTNIKIADQLSVEVPPEQPDVGQRCRTLLDELVIKTYTANDETLLELGSMLKGICDSMPGKDPIEVEVTYPVDSTSQIVYTLSNELCTGTVTL